MAPRALGALLALVAAIAFVVSIASSSWWSGHPVVDGHTISAKAVRVGLTGATGCNTGGDGRCEKVEVGGGFQTASLVELASVGVATILAFMLAVSAWRIGDHRKRLAAMMLFVSSLALVGAIGVLALGPAIKASQDVSVPIGWGTFVFGGAIVASLASSLVARGLEPEPLRLKTGALAPLQMAPNVRDMLREQHDGLRPSQLGPEPMLGPHAGAGSGSHTRMSAPLIGGAPQLRPLYEEQGFIPSAVSPRLPVSPPTPVPQSMIDAITGNTTPAPIPQTPSGARAPIPRTPHPSAQPPFRGSAPGVSNADLMSGMTLKGSGGAPRPQSPSNAPAPRTPNPDVPGSLWPTPPGGPRPHSPSSAPAPRPLSPSTAPPPRAHSPSAAPAPLGRPPVPLPARPKNVSVPMPLRPSPAPVPERSQPRAGTKADTVPPMPVTPAPVILPRHQRARTEADDRLEKGMRETDYITAVEIDAEAKAAIRAEPANSEILTGQVPAAGESTQTNLHIEAHNVVTGNEAALGSRDGHDDETSGQRPVTLELAAQTVLSEEDPLAALGKLSEQMAAQRISTTHETQLPPSMPRPAPSAPPRSSQRPRDTTQDAAPSRSTLEMAAQTTIGASDPLAGDSVAGARLSGEMMATTIGASDPLGGDSMQPGSRLSAELAAQDVGDVTDPSRNIDTDPVRREESVSDARIAIAARDRTPIPTQHPRAPTPPPVSTAPSHLAPPKPTEVAASGPTPACPQCESPMAWVDEHLRFYCKQCRMYF